ncbi:hypothetical protein OnM2_047018 [Erysiphe neolycopersici]|uniref:Uncharacterized protein n=1 Tax=Erysiphe neolycopersici TaxID=212602 RepID=A0A420HTT6_9PEZI|nr:hypothetical protein OnM2_047018 [Erysiphe neolycopersici]
MAKPQWSDDELEQLLSWWEAYYETTLSHNVKPARWATQVREAGLSTKTCPQIKQKWINWTTHSYKKARNIASKSNWEKSSDASFDGAARLDRICPRFWRLHSLLSNTVPNRPPSEKNSEKQESNEASRADQAPTVVLDQECIVNSDEIRLPSTSQSPVPSLSGSLLSPRVSSDTITAPTSGRSTPRQIDNQRSTASSAEIRSIESSFGVDNIEDNKHMPVKWSAKTTNIWAALIYEADQRRHIEEAKLIYAKSRDEKKARHELALKKLDMDEAQRQREHEVKIMNKKIELENIKLESIRNGGNENKYYIS